MNIALQVDSVAQKEHIFSLLNSWKDNGEASNISLFYEDIGPCEVNPKFGIFNITDIWYFTGYLVVTSLDGVSKVLNSVNKFKSALLYDRSQNNIFQIINTANNMPVIVTNEEDFNYIKRICNKEPVLIEKLNPDSIKEVIDGRHS